MATQQQEIPHEAQLFWMIDMSGEIRDGVRQLESIPVYQSPLDDDPTQRFRLRGSYSEHASRTRTIYDGNRTLEEMSAQATDLFVGKTALVRAVTKRTWPISAHTRESVDDNRFLQTPESTLSALRPRVVRGIIQRVSLEDPSLILTPTNRSSLVSENRFYSVSLLRDDKQPTVSVQFL